MSKRKLQEAETFAAITNDENNSSTKGSKKKQKKLKQKDVSKDIALFKNDLGDKPEPWRNKQRVLVFCGRGTNARFRHLMKDIRAMLPHSKKDVKLEPKDGLPAINEICEMRNCNSCIFFESKKGTDCYMWMSRTPNGPSAKFFVSNVHTLSELKLLGNCLLGSRPILTFDNTFDSEPHWKLLKELFTQIFTTPKGHPASKPFVDHMISFFILDDRIWVRHYQIATQQEGSEKGNPDWQLVEIGPRFVLHPIKILTGSFGGPVLYTNGEYISPNEMRRAANSERKQSRFAARVDQREKLQKKKASLEMEEDPYDQVFHKEDK